MMTDSDASRCAHMKRETKVAVLNGDGGADTVNQPEWQVGSDGNETVPNGMSTNGMHICA